MIVKESGTGCSRPPQALTADIVSLFSRSQEGAQRETSGTSPGRPVTFTTASFLQEALDISEAILDDVDDGISLFKVSTS